MAKLVSANLMGDKLCSLTYTTTDGKKISLGYNAFGDDVKIISHSYTDKGVILFDKPITTIRMMAFMGCKNLLSIVIPDSVTKIGHSAFKHCSNLTKVDISDLSAWCKIDFSAYDSNPLSSAKLYLNGKELTEIVIPSDISEIKQYTFRGCDNLTRVTIPDTVISIKNTAFSYCHRLKCFYGKYASLDNRCLVVNGELNSFAPAELSEYVVPYGVIKIGNGAFGGYDKLTSVKIPNSIVEIGRSAFSGCSGLTSMEIPNSVTKIGEWAFGGCSSLTRVAIPDSVTEIGYSAFMDCSGELTINSKIVENDYELLSKEYSRYHIAAGKSYWLSGARFSHITIGGNIQRIGNQVFCGCTNLTSIHIPDTITEIGRHAFEGCMIQDVYIVDLSAWCRISYDYDRTDMSFTYHNLYLNKDLVSNLIIPSDITEIKPFSFSACKSLISVDIPDNVVAIGDYAFYCCVNLQKITICKSITSIGNNALGLCDTLSFIDYKGDLSTWCKIDFGAWRTTWSNSPLLQFSINGNDVSEINIPSDITEIKPYTFDSFNKVSNITIPNSVKKIDKYAFNGCKNLTSITIPDSVTSVGTCAFGDCIGLTNVYIGNGVKELEKNAFSGCKNIASITIPDSITYVVDEAFDDFKNADVRINICDITKYCEHGISTPRGHLYINNVEITDLVIPNNATMIGNGVFRGCTSLTSIIIPDSVTYIGEEAFRGCSNLTSVTIGNGVTKIDDSAFESCDNLISIMIPDSVAYIGEEAFLNCSNLMRIAIGNGVTKIGKSAFEGCGNLTSIIIPNRITSVDPCTFRGCRSLREVVIPDNVTSIETRAFEDCESLLHLTIGKGVTEIGSYAFGGCNIDTLICRATTPPKLCTIYDSDWCEYRLTSFEQFETIIVPIGCEDAYSNSDWGRYLREEVVWYNERALEAQEKEYKDYARLLERAENGDYIRKDDDAEYESYLALGGDPDKYRNGCLDDYMDSIGM